MIDGFVMKSDRDAPRKVVGLVDRLQKKYLQEVNLDLRNLLQKDLPAFLLDETIMEHIRGLLREHDVAEYYLTMSPPGFVAVSRSGAVLLVIIMAPTDFTSHEEIIRDLGGATELLDRLAERSAVPYFWRGGGFYDPETDWRDQVVEAAAIGGAEATYAVAVVSDPQGIVNETPTIVPYNQFLEDIDSAAADP